MDDEHDDQDAPQEGVDYRASGIIDVWIEGERYRLRRPLVGQVRQLREAIDELSDESMRLLAKMTEAKPPKPDEDASAAEKRDFTLAVNALTRDHTATIESMNADWTRSAFDLLSDKALPDSVDAWPPWLLSGEFISGCMKHWQSGPLALGGR